MSDIKLLKIITGEELLAEITAEDASSVTLKNVLAVVLNPSREGISYGFMPWGNLSKDDKTISRSHVICSSEPTDEVKNSYNSMFGGIVTPVKQLIT